MFYPSLYALHSTPYTLHFTLYALHSTPYTFYSSLITHSLYLKLRFPSLVLLLYLPYNIPRMNQRRTKKRPKNSQAEKMLFIKIAVPFSSLIPCLKTPREHRETTERRALELFCKILRFFTHLLAHFKKKLYLCRRKSNAGV